MPQDTIRRSSTTIVAAQYSIATFEGHEIVLDLRNQTNAFLSSVNDIQNGIIRNRQRKRKLRYFSYLPLAAKNYVMEELKSCLRELKDRGAGDTLENLDTACWRPMILTGEAAATSAVRKRWESGFFVILPIDDIPIAIERGYFKPSPGNDSYWNDVEARAKRLGPPESLINFDSSGSL